MDYEFELWGKRSVAKVVEAGEARPAGLSPEQYDRVMESAAMRVLLERLTGLQAVATRPTRWLENIEQNLSLLNPSSTGLWSVANIANFYRSIAEHPIVSAILYSQATQWFDQSGSDGQKWKIVLDPASRYAVDVQGDRIYINPALLYQTSSGLRPIEMERLLIQALLQKIYPYDSQLPEEPFLGVGVIELMTDKILDDCGYKYPRQTAAATYNPNAPDTEGTKERLIETTTYARRNHDQFEEAAQGLFKNCTERLTGRG
ncbi:hypothetical protein NUH87_30855 [Pseudomonas batumici]|uniref:hypothetical protein n=1 Tax=Pseudomonas batumici TaxID=226910 RepID=UPI0030CC299F